VHCGGNLRANKNAQDDEHRDDDQRHHKHHGAISYLLILWHLWHLWQRCYQLIAAGLPIFSTCVKTPVAIPAPCSLSVVLKQSAVSSQWSVRLSSTPQISKS
jgi:hypothetical protein